MSTRLPIARALLEGADCRWAKPEPGRPSSGVNPHMSSVLHEALERSVFFDVQIGSDLYLAHPEKDYNLASSFGPLRLPYPDMWAEWQIRDDEYGLPIQFAAAVSEHQGQREESESECAPDHFRIRFAFLMRIPDMGNDVNALRIWPYFDVDKSGRYVPGSRKTTMFEDDVSPARQKLNRLQGEEGMCTVGLAMSLMNCKNVQTQESGRVNIRRSGAAKRRREPARTLRYHTILLPGGGSQSEGGGPSRTHRAAAVHRVRGHFKTFTAEAPLMGKHTGTYWWGWQVRGNKDAGMVVSDYKVEAS